MPYRPRVLVIDDDPLFRNLVVAMLRKDYIVSVAGEGSEGFYKALEHLPDIAIVDIQMPGWDGLKTLEAFRGHPQLKDVKMMMLTADASKETVVAAIQGGANDYLIKTSFSKDEFSEKMSKLTSSTKNPSVARTTPAKVSDAVETHPITETAASADEVHATESQFDEKPMQENATMSSSSESQLQGMIDDWE